VGFVVELIWLHLRPRRILVLVFSVLQSVRIFSRREEFPASTRETTKYAKDTKKKERNGMISYLLLCDAEFRRPFFRVFRVFRGSPDHVLVAAGLRQDLRALCVSIFEALSGPFA
jgi:hypothetical protein